MPPDRTDPTGQDEMCECGHARDDHDFYSEASPEACYFVTERGATGVPLRCCDCAEYRSR